MIERSETGCRLVSPAKDAPTRLGEMIAFRDGDTWVLAVVRRMQRQQVDEVICGVEVIARRIVRVLLRSWTAPLETPRARRRASFFRHLPAGALRTNGNRPSAASSDRRAFPDRRHGPSSHTGNARYLVRFYPRPSNARQGGPGPVHASASSRARARGSGQIGLESRSATPWPQQRTGARVLQHFICRMRTFAATSYRSGGPDDADISKLRDPWIRRHF
jgi:hypothetical protein